MAQARGCSNTVNGAKVPQFVDLLVALLCCSGEASWVEENGKLPGSEADEQL